MPDDFGQFTAQPSVDELHGYDPLEEYLDSASAHIALLQESTRRVVQNVLKSYTGFFDLFNEAIQNAMDALDAKNKTAPLGYKPKLYIRIDIPNRRVRVVDNGVGMSEEQFKLCFRPNTSFKNRREYRGNKGVGATFLAYGFSLITLQSKQGGNQVAAALRGGRDWAEEKTQIRPKLERIEFDCPELAHETSGSCVDILVGESQRPRLAWLGAKGAESWYDVLRIRTPLGGVYLSKAERDGLIEPEVELTLISADHEETLCRKSVAEYYYPHEMPLFDATKVKTVGDITKMEQEAPGSNLRAKAEKIPDSFKRLEAVWEIWDADQLIAHPVLSKELTYEQKALLAQHKVTVYGFFISSARLWSQFQTDSLKVHSNARLLEGGLQLASDHMVQGDLMVIPLTSEAGYHRHAHILVHFVDGNPDMGRKVFQPELKEVAEEIARRAVDVFKSYKTYMKGDSGAPPQQQMDKHFDWLVAQKNRRDQSALNFEHNGNRLPFITQPCEEQDVISLFNQLLGAGVVRGIFLISTSLDTQYDCCYVAHYPNDSFRFQSGLNSLGVSTDSIQPDGSKPLTLEFKYSLDGLISDFDNNVKYPADIDAVVVWELGTYYATSLDVSSLLSPGAGSGRRLFAATHRGKKAGGGSFEIICLSDLLRYIQSPAEVEAEHKVHFGL